MNILQRVLGLKAPKRLRWTTAEGNVRPQPSRRTITLFPREVFMNRFALCVVALVCVLAGPARAPAADTDADKIQGVWDVVSVTQGGEENKVVAGSKLVIAGDKMRFKKGEEEATYRFKLDPTKKPKAIDVVTGENEKVPGIYLLERDSLKLCVDNYGKARPTEFVSKVGREITLIVLKRDKK
jgi:uncharacterized protein (TIGR03067 family)